VSGAALAPRAGMVSPRDTVMVEHQRLRALLQGVIIAAAQAREGELGAALQLSPRIEELRAELARHALAEDVHIGPLLAALDNVGLERRDLLDEEHAQEAQAASGLRTASGLGQMLEHIAAIELALEAEEQQLDA
jgi:hypothetical protein